MGRIAGPPSKSSISNAWKAEVAHRVYLKKYTRPKPLAAVPSARKRQQALLWALVKYKPEGMPVGLKGYPPYTKDMRELVRRGLVIYARNIAGGIGYNYIIATESGKIIANSKMVNVEQIKYIGNAFGSASIR